VSRARTLALTVAGALAAAIYVLRLDDVAGYYVDDAWYVLFARALARGEGYTMVNSPIAGLMPPGPPGFPALLSIVFALPGSDFPANVVWLKLVSILAMAGVGLLSYRYYVHREVRGDLAVLLAFATVITPALVFMATSTIMSECVYALGLVATLVVFDRTDGRPRTVAAAVLAAATVMVRTAGLALPLAIGAYLVATRQFRRAVLFALVTGACVAPWFVYERLNTPPLERRIQHGGAHVFSYPEQFRMRLAGDPSLGEASAREIAARIGVNTTDVFGRVVAALVAPALLRGPSESGEEVFAVGELIHRGGMGGATGVVVVSSVLSGVAAVGFVVAVRRRLSPTEFLIPISLLMTVLFPMWPTRFVLPLTPFLFFYLARGSLALTRSTVGPTRILLLVVIGLNLLDHGQYIALYRTGQRVEWIADARDADTMLHWIARELPAEARIATTNPPLVYLRTGRQTVSAGGMDENWDRWKRQGIHYVASLLLVDPPHPAYGYRMLFRSPHRQFWLVQMD
jgi:hypothetical protein